MCVVYVIAVAIVMYITFVSVSASQIFTNEFNLPANTLLQ